MSTANILASPIEYLKGVGPQRAELLKKELGIFTFQDLLEHYPYRHVDRTKINLIRDIRPDMEFVQVVGKVMSSEVVGDRRARRLVVELRDATGVLQLVWFQGVTGMQKLVQVGGEYLAFGRVSYYQGSPQLTHPEVEKSGGVVERPDYLEPVYPSTEKLKARGSSRIIDRRGILRRSGREIPLTALSDIGYRQTIFDRVIGAGDVVIESAGRDGQEVFPDLRHPARIQNEIYSRDAAQSARLGAGADTAFDSGPDRATGSAPAAWGHHRR